MATPVLIDCDPGHDDAIAILLALASPELDVLGITTVSGNQTLDKTTANAIRVLDLLGRDDVEVAAGADRPLLRPRYVAAYVHGESGLDGPTLPPPSRPAHRLHAVDFIAEQVMHAEGPVTLIPVGPLTNVALFLARYPDHAERIGRIVLMGGAIAEGNVTPAAEFNVWADPEAAQRVFGSGLDVTMIGLDVTHEALMTRAMAERLRDGGKVGRFVAELYDFFSIFHRTTYGSEDSPIHDAVAVAHVVREGIVETAHRHVVVDCQSELCRGRTVVDLWRRTGNEPNCDVGVAIDRDAFFALLLERLATLR
ncbi:MAG: nucleoside hydrolase [Pseudomonadota bacterium]